MRNVDKIKNLEYELGRYRKKVADQETEIKALKDDLATADKGMDELRQAMDAILAQVGVAAGKEIKDEESGELLGWRITIPQVPVSATLEKYEVRATLDRRAKEYTIGVLLREEPDAGKDAT